MMCVAMKEFKGNGEIFVKNQLVDSGMFRNGDALIATRYLRPASSHEVRSARRVYNDTPSAPRKKKGLKVRIRRG